MTVEYASELSRARKTALSLILRRRAAIVSKDEARVQAAYGPYAIALRTKERGHFKS